MYKVRRSEEEDQGTVLLVHHIENKWYTCDGIS